MQSNLIKKNLDLDILRYSSGLVFLGSWRKCERTRLAACCLGCRQELGGKPLECNIKSCKIRSWHFSVCRDQSGTGGLARHGCGSSFGWPSSQI